ncbi:exopolysaccharide biosynthesis protein [Synechococcus sp. PCC 6312]|uniref:exopolysaccharide biosynthesis protein n=1 Tax=Synechococcus sp. (strain ATCC 27167 / PCC 6312) TaxID=195253 RepID=UPI00029F2F8A|nr:exopolysaccharide biosynthesis protein [Synechococcus sp. PCC 6312]AFY61670.1 putative ABC-type transport system, permease component [Synechococcus sp. PCC 6312]
MAKLSQDLHRYFIESPPPEMETVSLAALLDQAGERIFGFLLVILSLPSALPIPAPGYSTPFGVALFLLALQLIAGKTTPWLPNKIMHYQIPLPQAQGVIKAGIPWLKRIEAISRPRLLPICTSTPGRVILGMAIALMAISMMIPIPGTNTLPAMGIFVVGFGLLDDDGVICLGGLVLCLMGAILSTSIIAALVWGGTSLYDTLKEGLKSLFQ